MNLLAPKLAWGVRKEIKILALLPLKFTQNYNYKIWVWLDSHWLPPQAPAWLRLEHWGSIQAQAERCQEQSRRRGYLYPGLLRTHQIGYPLVSLLGLQGATQMMVHKEGRSANEPLPLTSMLCLLAHRLPEQINPVKVYFQGLLGDSVS